MKKLTKAELIEKYAELEDKFYEKSDECGDLRRDNDRLDTINVELQDKVKRLEDKVKRLENQIHYLAGMLGDKVKLYYRNYSGLFDVEIKFGDEEDNDKPFPSAFTYCNK